MPNGDRTRHRRYLEENVGAADVSLGAADMPTLDAALAPGRISGQRDGPKQAAMVDR